MRSADHATTPSTRAPIGIQGAIAVSVLVVLVWFSQATLPIGIVRDGPDGSFQSALDQFFVDRARAGVDWVYTYGPLGTLQVLTYHPDLLWFKIIVWEVALKALCAVVVVAAVLRHTRPLDRAVPLAALILLGFSPDAYLYISLLAAADMALERPQSTIRAIALGIIVVMTSQAKFTGLALAAPIVLVVAYVRWREVSRRAALWFAGSVVLGWLAVWVLAGQSLFDIPIFLWRSLQVTQSYNAAMSSESQPGIDTLAVEVALLVAGIALLSILGRGRSASTRLRGAVQVFVLFGVFKAGLVRGDHAFIFLIFGTVAAFLALPPAVKSRFMGAGIGLARHGSAFLALVGLVQVQAWNSGTWPQVPMHLAGQINTVWAFYTEPRAMVARLESEMASARRIRDLPRCRAVIQDSTVDVFPPFQDAVLINRFNWRPRPVFQPYATMSRTLQDLNAEFMESDRAPSFLLFEPWPIDAHLATMEDSSALQVIARDYRPVLFERDFLLLRREPRVRTDEDRAREREARTVVLDRTLRFDETLEMPVLPPSACLLLQLDVRLTLAGRMRQGLVRATALAARVTTATGRQWIVRVIPEMLQGGAIVDPVLADNRDWRLWYQGEPERLRSIVFLRPEPSWTVHDEVHVRLVRADDIVPVPSAALAEPVQVPPFRPQPDALSAHLPDTIEVDGAPAFLVNAPATVTFKVSPGHHVIRGSFGVMPDALGATVPGGVHFGVQLAVPGQPLVKLYARQVDPQAMFEDRGTQQFSVEFEAPQNAEILLRTVMKNRDDPVVCRAYWQGVAIE